MHGPRELTIVRPKPVAATETSTRAAAELDDLYRRHVGDVYRYTYAVLGNHADAEDVTQTTFVNALRALERGETPRAASTWLIAIAQNVVRQRWRQAASRPSEVELVHDVPDVPADDDIELDELVRALQRIPPAQREALVMRELEGRSYNEISELLGHDLRARDAALPSAPLARGGAEALVTCQSAELAISKQLDGRLSRKDRRRLDEHLSECEDCARLAATAKRQRRAFKGPPCCRFPSGLPLQGERRAPLPHRPCRRSASEPSSSANGGVGGVGAAGVGAGGTATTAGGSRRRLFRRRRSEGRGGHRRSSDRDRRRIQWVSRQSSTSRPWCPRRSRRVPRLHRARTRRAVPRAPAPCRRQRYEHERRGRGCCDAEPRSRRPRRQGAGRRRPRERRRRRLAGHRRRPGCVEKSGARKGQRKLRPRQGTAVRRTARRRRQARPARRAPPRRSQRRSPSPSSRRPETRRPLRSRSPRLPRSRSPHPPRPPRARRRRPGPARPTGRRPSTRARPPTPASPKTRAVADDPGKSSGNGPTSGLSSRPARLRPRTPRAAPVRAHLPGTLVGQHGRNHPPLPPRQSARAQPALPRRRSARPEPASPSTSASATTQREQHRPRLPRRRKRPRQRHGLRHRQRERPGQGQA